MSVRVKIDHDKVMKRVDKAKWKTILALKSQIAKDTNANVPKRDSFLRNSVFRSTSKKDNFLKWGGFAVLYAHFQWKGKVMVEKNPVVRGRNVEKRRYIHQGIYLMVQVDRIGSK